MHVTPKILHTMQNRLDKRSHACRIPTHVEHVMSLCESRLALSFLWRCHWTTACWTCTAVSKVRLTPSLPTQLSVKMEVTGTEHRRAQTPVRAGPVLLAKAFQKEILTGAVSFQIKNRKDVTKFWNGPFSVSHLVEHCNSHDKVTKCKSLHS